MNNIYFEIKWDILCTGMDMILKRTLDIKNNFSKLPDLARFLYSLSLSLSLSHN